MVAATALTTSAPRESHIRVNVSMFWRRARSFAAACSPIWRRSRSRMSRGVCVIERPYVLEPSPGSARAAATQNEGSFGYQRNRLFSRQLPTGHMPESTTATMGSPTRPLGSHCFFREFRLDDVVTDFQLLFLSGAVTGASLVVKKLSAHGLTNQRAHGDAFTGSSLPHRLGH
jgi:hypothetical protein